MIKRVVGSIKYRTASVYNKLSWKIKPYYFSVFPNKVVCNLCGWKENQFLSDSWHSYIICPNCRSQIRQRLFWASIKSHSVLSKIDIIANKKVLHFAPDASLKEQIKGMAKEYVTADFFAKGYQYESIDLDLDMSNMPSIGNEQFDCVIAFDVLEHVKDHLKGIEEVNRILKIGGYCIFTIPQKDNLQNTYEDLSALSDEERKAKFGQWDHWRIYGADFKDMLADRGFEVTVVSSDDFDQDLAKKEVLFPPILSNNEFASNYRNVFFGKKILSLT